MRPPTIESTVPSIDDSKASKGLDEMMEAQSGDISISITITQAGKEQVVHLTKENHPALTQAICEIAKGKAVIVLPIDAELSTQRAADLLNVSRPFFIKLLENNEIPFRTVGTWRRVKLADVLVYKRESDEQARACLQELMDQAQDLDMGY